MITGPNRPHTGSPFFNHVTRFGGKFVITEHCSQGYRVNEYVESAISSHLMKGCTMFLNVRFFIFIFFKMKACAFLSN